MHPLLAAGTGTGWVDGRRGDDFELTAEQRRGAGARAPAGRRLPLLAEQPDRHRAATWTWSSASLAEAPGMVVVDEAYAEFARPGTPSALSLLPAHPRLVVTRTMSKAFALRRRPASATWPPTRRGRRGAAGPAALPPVGADPGRRARRAGARAGPAGQVEAIKEQRDRIVGGLRELGLTGWPTATPTSSSSDGSRRPERRSGRRCSTAGCWSATSACPAGCGSPPARPDETDAFLAARSTQVTA